MLDEFHRIGSEIWGHSVQKLLMLYADTPILGFSATNIRYLDNQCDLAVPHHYKTEDGYLLGSWLQTQRKVRSGEQYGILTEERIEKLDEIGMIWDSYRDFSWKKRFSLAQAYYKEHGNLNVPAKYTVNGVWLNKWLNEQRQIYLSKRGSKCLPQEQISKLSSLGVIR